MEAEEKDRLLSEGELEETAGGHIVIRGGNWKRINSTFRNAAVPICSLSGRHMMSTGIPAKAIMTSVWVI